MNNAVATISVITLSNVVLKEDFCFNFNCHHHQFSQCLFEDHYSLIRLSKEQEIYINCFFTIWGVSSHCLLLAVASKCLHTYLPLYKHNVKLIVLQGVCILSNMKSLCGNGMKCLIGKSFGYNGIHWKSTDKNC